jgi:hypothetical protein
MLPASLAMATKTTAEQPYLYPNPAKDWVKIQSKGTGLFSITDLQGKVIKNGRLEAGANAINIGGIPDGVYFVKFNNQVFKLIISNR